ncbi:MAG TPA: DUF4397 domain-containing protein [Ignavibacteriaceae bacterium]|nr:DUF4397 domain-containing protein [Ignavibacteriaceae bacterium]
MKFKNLVLALAVSITAFTFIGCDDEEDPVQPVPSNSSTMVIHTSPDAPGADILVDNAIAATNLTYLQNTPYVTLPSGTRNIKVNVTGTSTTVIQADLDFVKDKAYSIFAVNSVANIEPLVLEDNLAAPASGKVHVRFIHLSPDAPAVDITLADGTVVFGNVSFKGNTPFTPLDGGSYNLQVRLAGTSTVVLDLGSVTLPTGKILTVYARGFVAGAGAQELGASVIENN